jgi:hypothetical protein
VYCWQGLKFETLSYNDIENLIKSLPDFDETPTKRQGVISGNTITEYVWSVPNDTDDNSRYISVVLENDTPTSLTRSFLSLSLGKVIDRFGEPSHVLVYEAGPPSHMQVSITIVYETQGILFFSEYVPNRHPDPLKAKVTSQVKIWAYMIGSSSGLEELMYTQLLNPEWRSDEEYRVRVREFTNQAQSWKGYAVYDVTPIY